jgi:hypothetical protein
MSNLRPDGIAPTRAKASATMWHKVPAWALASAALEENVHDDCSGNERVVHHHPTDNGCVSHLHRVEPNLHPPIGSPLPEVGSSHLYLQLLPDIGAGRSVPATDPDGDGARKCKCLPVPMVSLRSPIGSLGHRRCGGGEHREGDQRQYEGFPPHSIVSLKYLGAWTEPAVACCVDHRAYRHRCLLDTLQRSARARRHMGMTVQRLLPVPSPSHDLHR